RDYTKKEVGTFIAEALAEWSGADAVLYNGGGIRGGLKAGPVTAEDIFLSEPFGNRLVVGEISGERLALIGEIKSRRQHDFFRGPAFIDPAKTYLLATSDFLAQGGSAYGLALKDKAGGSGKLVWDILTDYLLKNVLKQDLPPAASY
ncbi:MAG TPA: hypothetical protein GX528_07685, partial [Firmicutes bacterium]|nr:hypothetical protein [Bacillota bacterium]